MQHGFAVGAMGYGNIEDLASGPAFNQQDHRIGPAVFFDVPMDKGRDLDVSIGTYFGMTSAAPEASVMLNFGIPSPGAEQGRRQNWLRSRVPMIDTGPLSVLYAGLTTYW